jgi:hypothetical protein
MSLDQVRAILAEPDDSGRTVAAVLGGHGGDRRSERAREQERVPALDSHRGETKERQLARLRRDDPDLAARVDRRDELGRPFGQHAARPLDRRLRDVDQGRRLLAADRYWVT